MWILLLIGLLSLAHEDDPTLEYFFANRTANGWVLDRQSNRNVVSVAASGMGADAWAIAVDRGRLDRATCIKWIDDLITNTVRANQGNHGWLYHFTDPQGLPIFTKEVSSIDTAIFWAGVRQGVHRVGDPGLIERVEIHISKIDRSWMLTNDGEKPDKKLFSHGCHWQNGKPIFLHSDWDDYNEGILIYKLLDVRWEPRNFSPALPLFAYYYPLCFYDDPTMKAHLKAAVSYQIEQHGVFGYTACDGPTGYHILEPDVVSPLAVSTCKPFCPDEYRIVMKKLETPPLTPSLHLKTRWISKDRIGIDDGAYLLITNPPKR